jgi:hypothetical protein
MVKLETIHYKMTTSADGSTFAESVEVGLNVLGDEAPLTDDQKIKLDELVDDLRLGTKRKMTGWRKETTSGKATTGFATYAQKSALRRWYENPKYAKVIDSLMELMEVEAYSNLLASQASEILTTCGEMADAEKARKVR